MMAFLLLLIITWSRAKSSPGEFGSNPLEGAENPALS